MGKKRTTSVQSVKSFRKAKSIKLAREQQIRGRPMPPDTLTKLLANREPYVNIIAAKRP